MKIISRTVPQNGSLTISNLSNDEYNALVQMVEFVISRGYAMNNYYKMAQDIKAMLESK